HESLERGQHAVALRAVKRPGFLDVRIDGAGLQILRDPGLGEDVGAEVHRLLGYDELRDYLRPRGYPAQPRSRGEYLREGPEADHVASVLAFSIQLIDRGQALSEKAYLAVGRVLDHKEPVLI